MSQPKLSKLSFDKFTKLLSQHGYIINMIYYVDDVSQTDVKLVKFLEVRLPKTQKIVVVHISSDKYVMSLPTNPQYKAIEIISIDNEGVKNAAFLLTEQSLQYLLNVRGPLIESDLVVISSDGICYSRFNGENQCYFLAGKIKKITEEVNTLQYEDILEDERDEIGIIEDELEVVAKDEGITLEKIEYENVVEEIAENVVEEKENEVKEETTVTEDIKNDKNVQNSVIEKVELEFVDDEAEDDEGGEENVSSEISVVSSSEEEEENVKEEVEKTKMSTAKAHVPNVKKSSDVVTPKVKKDMSKNTHTTDKPVMKFSQRCNYVIPDELDVYYGVIFVAINIGNLFKTISVYETSALSVYEQIEDNEKDMRVSRLNNIQANLVLATKHIDIRAKEIEINERSLKYQLLRLTGILNNVDEIKNHLPQTITQPNNTPLIGNTPIHKNSDKKNDIITNPKLLEMERIYNKTRKTIHEINIQLIKHRDEFEDLFSNYEYMINELLGS